MDIKETKLEGCFVIEHKVFNDERGLFFEAYQKKNFEKMIGREINFVQDNYSVSKKGVLRGLHFQKGQNSQSKLGMVIKGEVLDVVVDLRKDSRTFGQHFKIKLSDRNKKSLFVPKGLAHGFVVLSEEAIFAYKCDNYYHKEAESGIFYKDEDLNIDWEYPMDKVILSQKDKDLPSFKACLL